MSTACTFGPPPGLDVPGFVDAAASGSSKDQFTLLRTDQHMPSGVWDETKNFAVQLQERLTLEVAHLSRLLCELGGKLGELLMCRSEELVYAFALDEAVGHGLPQFAAFILVSLDLIADQGREARKAVHEAIIAAQNVIILVCSRGLTLADLGSQGMPSVLKQRIALLFSLDSYHDERLSRLGVAKYHLFNEGTKFSRRKARMKMKAEIVL